jgi:hypothetical protein
VAKTRISGRIDGPLLCGQLRRAQVRAMLSIAAANDIPPHVDKLLSKPPRLHELRAALAELVT